MATAGSPGAARTTGALSNCKLRRGTPGWPGAGSTMQIVVSPLCISTVPSGNVTLAVPTTQ
jgi:hypothetical protein